MIYTGCIVNGVSLTKDLFDKDINISENLVMLLMISYKQRLVKAIDTIFIRNTFKLEHSYEKLNYNIVEGVVKEELKSRRLLYNDIDGVLFNEVLDVYDKYKDKVNVFDHVGGVDI